MVVVRSVALAVLLAAAVMTLAARLVPLPCAVTTRFPTQMLSGMITLLLPIRSLDEALTNAIHSLLADAGDHPGSPPSASASPALSKVTPDTTNNDEKKDE